MKFHRSTTSAGPTVVLLPGWATDYRIFDRLPRAASTIIPLSIINGDFSKDLADYIIAEGLGSISLFGWSLGGAAALKFAHAYPELVDSITLAGVRPSYPAAELDAMRLSLNADKEACLTDFYRRCFLPSQREDYRQFKQTLLAEYLQSWSSEELQRGLDFLEEAAFDAAALAGWGEKLTIFHGALDIVSPVSEIVSFAAQAGVERVEVFPNASHAVFIVDREGSLHG